MAFAWERSVLEPASKTPVASAIEGRELIEKPKPGDVVELEGVLSPGKLSKLVISETSWGHSVFLRSPEIDKLQQEPRCG